MSQIKDFNLLTVGGARTFNQNLFPPGVGPPGDPNGPFPFPKKKKLNLNEKQKVFFFFFPPKPGLSPNWKMGGPPSLQFGARGFFFLGKIFGGPPPPLPPPFN